LLRSCPEAAAAAAAAATQQQAISKQANNSFLFPTNEKIFACFESSSLIITTRTYFPVPDK
jgi:hypothetical protein